MSLPRLSASQRLALGAALLVSAAASALVAWLHAASLGEAVFLCGSAEAHCWACYAAPLLAALSAAVLAAPEASPVRARS